MSPKRKTRSGKKVFFAFTLALSLATGSLLAVLVSPSRATFVLYEWEDTVTGEAFEVRAPAAEESHVRALFAGHPGVLDFPDAEPWEGIGGEPLYRRWRFTGAKEVIYWSPYATAFLQGAGAVWGLYFFIAYAVRGLVVRGYRERLAEERVRGK